MAMICINGARECTGCMACQPEPTPPVCPICDEETDTYYYDKDGELVGCGECIHTKDAWEVDESA